MAKSRKPLKGNNHSYRKHTGDSVKRLKMQLLGEEAYLLRIQGFSYREISAKLGGRVSDSKVYDYIKAAMQSESHTSADRAHLRLEQDARYRALLQTWWPRAIAKKPNLGALNGVMAILKRLDEIWGLDLGKQLERDGISDALLAVLHEVQARPLALPNGTGSTEIQDAALPSPGTLDAIWDEMESSGEVESAEESGQEIEPPDDDPPQEHV